MKVPVALAMVLLEDQAQPTAEIPYLREKPCANARACACAKPAQNAQNAQSARAKPRALRTSPRALKNKTPVGSRGKPWENFPRIKKARTYGKNKHFLRTPLRLFALNKPIGTYVRILRPEELIIQLIIELITELIIKLIIICIIQLIIELITELITPLARAQKKEDRLRFWETRPPSCNTIIPFLLLLRYILLHNCDSNPTAPYGTTCTLDFSFI